MFHEADKDQSGLLNFNELYLLAVETNQKLGQPAPTEGEVRILFNKSDQNKDRKINLQEFMDFMMMNLRKMAEIERKNDQEKASKK